MSALSTLAGIIQGEASNPADQYGVASTIYNRVQAGFPGSSQGAFGVATARAQFSAYPNRLGVPSPYATSLAQDLLAGNPPGTSTGTYGTTGNALYYNAPGYNPAYASGVGNQYGPGTNQYSDVFNQPPSQNFQLPQQGSGGAFTTPYSAPFTGDFTNGGLVSSPFTDLSQANLGQSPQGNFAPDSTGSFTGIPSQAQVSSPDAGFLSGADLSGNVAQSPSGGQVTNTPILSPYDQAPIGTEANIPFTLPGTGQTYANTFGGTQDFSYLAPSGVIPADTSGTLFNPNSYGDAGQTFMTPIYDNSGNIIGAGTPGSLASVIPGLGGSGSSDTTPWYQTLLNDLGDWTKRIGLGLVGIIFLFIAAWFLTSGAGAKAVNNARSFVR